MRRKKNKQMEGQMSIFDMFSSVIENTKTEEENVTVSEGGIAAADITAVETGTQTSIFDLFSTDEQDTQNKKKSLKRISSIEQFSSQRAWKINGRTI